MQISQAIEINFRLTLPVGDPRGHTDFHKTRTIRWAYGSNAESELDMKHNDYRKSLINSINNLNAKKAEDYLDWLEENVQLLDQVEAVTVKIYLRYSKESRLEVHFYKEENKKE